MAFAFYLVERFTANELMNLFLMVGALAAIGSLFLVVFFPEYGLQNRDMIPSGAWEGIFPHKNNCGQIMTFLMLPAFFIHLSSRSAKIVRVAYIALVLLIIVMSQSAGAWVVCGACYNVYRRIAFVSANAMEGCCCYRSYTRERCAIAGIVVYKYFDVLMLRLEKIQR